MKAERSGSSTWDRALRYPPWSPAHRPTGAPPGNDCCSFSSLPFSFPPSWLPAQLRREQVRGGNLRRQNQGQNEQDSDNGPVHPVIPGLVRVLAQKFFVVQQKLQKD